MWRFFECRMSAYLASEVRDITRMSAYLASEVRDITWMSAYSVEKNV